MFSEYVLAGSSMVSLDFLPPALCTTENSTEPSSKTLNENLRTDGALMSIGTSKSSPGARLCTRESIVPALPARPPWQRHGAPAGREGKCGPSEFRVIAHQVSK